MIIKWSLLTIFLFLTISSISQTKTSKTFYPNGKIKSVAYARGNSIIRGKLYFENGKIEKEYNIKDGNLFGWQIDYDTAGKKLKELFVLGVDQVNYGVFNDTVENDKMVDVISGKEILYFQNGNKKSEGFIVNAFKAGFWTYYNPDGTIKAVVFYKTLTKDNNPN